MKAYKVNGTYCDTIFYVGHKSQVESQLKEFFLWQFKQDHAQKQPLTNGSEFGHSMFQNDHGENSKKSFAYSSNQSSLNSLQKKHMSIHILLYDLELHQYNDFQSYINVRFQQQLNKYSSSTSLHFVMISSREQSLKYIKKIDKFNDPQFQSNLVDLYQELNQGMEYELIKNFMQENFNYSREEIFQWMKSTEVKKLEEFFVCQSMPSFQKKEVRRVLTNLTVLEQLYEK